MKRIYFAGAAVISLAAIIAGAATAQQAAAPAPGQPHHMRADADSDGRISQAEFVQGRVSRLTALDANRDGTVTVEEAQAAMQARRAEMATARFDRLDANKDGSISRAEFDAPRAAGERGPRGDRMGHRGGRGGPHRMGGHRGGPDGTMGRGGHERGPIVISEAQTKATDAFARMDANHDGYLTAEEGRAARTAMRGERHERRAERTAQRQSRTQASPSTPASE